MRLNLASISWFLIMPALVAAYEFRTVDHIQDYAALVSSYEAANEVWRQSVPQPLPAANARFWIDNYQSAPTWTFAPRFMAFAETTPRVPETAAALIRVVRMSHSSDQILFPLNLRAVELLIRDHLEDPLVMQAMDEDRTINIVVRTSYLHALLASSHNRDTLARACIRLVESNELRLRVAARPPFDHPEDHPELRERTEFTNARLDPRFTAYFHNVDVAALTQENEALLNRVVTEFAEIPLIARWARPEVQTKNASRKLADIAQAKLYRIRNLSVGRPAPEIGGQDLDGKLMRLSEYRGKVVVLVFWGDWCAPCRGLIPKEKELVARLKGQPFALVGINSDAHRDQAQATVTREGVTWRSWFDGGKVGGPIADRWDVHSWPTIIVLDKSGVIRFKGLPHHTPKPLDDAVSLLLAEP